MPEGSVNPSNEESPRLSTASVSSNERAPSATPSDLSDAPPPAGQPPRPVSLISTLSSGSASSRDDSLAPPTSESSGSNPAHVDLELRPPEGHAHTDTGEDTGPEGGRGHCRGWVHQRTNKEPAPAATGDGSMSPNPQLTYLDRVVMEIIETERMYVRDLRMIVEDYLSHIIDQAELSIRPEQVCSLFGNIEDIYEFNSELLQSLDLCDNDPVAVARCFVMKTEDFDIYTQYCTNYPNSVAALTECMRNKSLAKFFRERQATLKRSLPLGSYLLKPVQRILKYHLLLQEIAKHFDPEEEEGYEVVQEAIFTMTGVAWYINDMKRKHEHSVRLQEVQSLLLNWKGADLTTYGELALEGTFKVHRAKNERTLFLFERVLLITKRRGDHYVYKSHISCSTLMLMESSKDSLCFSVTHYKHPKQPTTVQARTVEEKKLWTHHIKRLILENHHAIIPQKAKEAILEMDSVYRSRYRYSPDRLKKTLSCQSDEGPRERPLSEPNNQTVKNNSNAVLKHADSEGSLPGDDRVSHGAPLGPAATTAAPRHRHREAEEVAHNSDEDEGRPNSPEHLSGASDNEEEEEEEEGTRTERTEEDARGDTPMADDGSDADDALMLLRDEQVEEDFASSMLAAISCWHYRARALLSTGAWDDLAEEMASDRADDTGDELQHKQSAVENPAEPTGGIEPATLPSDPDRPPVNPPPTTLSTSPRRTAPPADKASSPGTPESDSKTLSSAESSDEEEKETSILPSSVLDQAGAIALHFTPSTRRGSVPAADDTRSLGCPSPRLPSRTGSTLSLAAEPADRSHRLNSACSDAQENFGTTDLTLLSPREDSLFDSDLRGGALRRRRDSTLSKQDQLLIGKIKCYYETAESQDPVFSLRRRESLSYIPAGLVRNSVTKINSIPKDPTSDATSDPTSDTTVSEVVSEVGSEVASTAKATDKNQPPETAWTDDSPSLVPEAGTLLAAESSLSAIGSRGRCPVSSVSRDSVVPDRPQRVREERPVEDEEFKPSSEMIKIWRAMEQDVCRTQGEVGHRGGGGREKRSRELARNSRVSGLSLSNRNQTPKKSGGERDSMADSDLTTIKEESAGPSPLKTTSLSRSGGLKAVRRSCDEEGGLLRARLPRVQQLRAEAEGERSREPEPPDEEEDKTKSKVMSLARQYSQKIKSGKQPVVQHRSPHKKLPCVLEETDSSGKPTLSSPLTSPHETLSSSRLRPRPSPAPTSDTTTATGPRRLLPLPSSPCQNPIPARSPTEGFHWPHVRELRSKYVPDPDLAPLAPPVGRSQSVPERMFERRSSCSSNLFQASTDSASHQSHLSREERRSARLHRTSSLDHRLNSGAHPTDPENKHTHTVKLPNGSRYGDDGGYYTSGWASCGGRKLVVVEKVPDSSPSGGAEPAQEAREEEEEEEAGQEVDDGNYVQIRSPTSREKMSIMAVIERCRAYQESDEYKQREEDEEQKTDDATQSIVRNLREKFQNLK